MAGRKKKGGGGGHGNSERWLLTYADMITLLMAFFIMMYSMSVLDLQKFQMAADSLRNEFGKGQVGAGGENLLKGGAPVDLRPSIIPFSTPSPKAASDRMGIGDGPGSVSKPGKGMGKGRGHAIERAAEFQKLKVYLKQHNLTHLVRVQSEKRGLVISLLADGMLFPAGSAQLTPTCRGILERLAAAIRKVPNDVCVEGHTCDLPPRSPVFPSNWELSTARASNVVRFFINSEGMAARRLSVAGYAAMRPVAPNDTEEHRVLNRRVNIVLLEASGP